MMSLNLGELVKPVLAIAREAGAAILEVYHQADIDVTRKADDSPLTQADLAADAVIRQGLKAHSDLPIMSEEVKALPYQDRQKWSAFWLVDPLDGTKEFLKRNGEFTVNIALVVAGEPVLGVVYAPVRQTLYWGVQGEGSFKQVGDEPPQPIRVLTEVGPNSKGQACWKIVSSRSHANSETTTFLERLEADQGAVEIVAVGSSLKFCLVAEGAANVYPRFGPTMEWDTGAAQCVVEQAGGKVLAMNGDRLQYNKENLLNPYFIVTDGSGLAWQTYC